LAGTEIKDNIKTDFSELSSGSEKNANADICVSIHFLFGAGLVVNL